MEALTRRRGQGLGMAFECFGKEAVSVAAVAICMFAGSVQAQSPDGVDIAVTATVAERCGFTPGAMTTLDVAADLEDAHSQDLSLRIDCNTPFTISARAGSGRLVNQSASDDNSGYAFEKTYGLRVQVDTDAGQVQSGRCLSTDLRDGGDCILAQPSGLGSGEGVAIRRDAVLTVDGPSQTTLGRRLAAGRYSDTVTLTIGARA